MAVTEEPFVSCEHNLLGHVSDMQDNVESRLDLIEEQISGKIDRYIYCASKRRVYIHGKNI